MKHSHLILLSALSVGMLSACSATPEPGYTVVESQVLESNTVSATATVIAIDPALRAVTIEHSGRLVTIFVDPKVPDFDELKVGDAVKTEYVESVALRVQAHDGEPRIQNSAKVNTDTPDDGVAAVEKTEVISDILAIDQTAKTITVVGPQGHEVTMPVAGHDKELKKIKVGDQVVVTYTKAVAVSIQKAPQGAHPQNQ